MVGNLDAEFEDRLGRLIRGPMWSGLPSSDVGDPLKARVNLAAMSKRTTQRRTSTSEFTTTPKIQTPAVKSITETNPNGRFWLKLDGTDVKESLQHSVKNIWNGDVDLNDGQLEFLRDEYQSRLDWINSIQLTTEEDLKTSLETGLVNLELDEKFLQDAFKKATNDFRKKMNQKNANSETLKGLNWEVVECNTLLQQCLEFMSKLKSDSDSRANIKSISQEYPIYLKNLFKKKRTAVTHILVIAISDEQRNIKPYALPIQYLPYKSLRDQYVRDITEPIKNALTLAGINVVGLVTDGEFNSLRTQGDTGPLHTWQLVHDSKEVVRKMSKATLESMLTYDGDDENGIPFAELPNEYIPSYVLLDMVDMLNDGLTFEDSIVYLCGKLVPEGYTPYPFRRDTPESFIDRLRSLVSTYVYRHTVSSLKSEGRDLSQHLYMPEIDKTTCKQHHERGDHNHVLKRIATSTRECRYQELDPEAFDKALLDPRAGLSHAALTGQRPQSVEDAEKLLSYHVAARMQRNGLNM
ncbi:uncharacterized protein LOC110456903 isoform X1 [Mizuhopecten yessoensis]|uniref:uncharacterized protein LOC110456903 isoform X1 n=1 Tax=Mizuhopecten yessoensis TaxID=6573 RepID=UPI000B4580F4|nr:uncharacterized protein LOC110456903 isoform X1 [Mizuhopecten yessoensis]